MQTVTVYNYWTWVPGEGLGKIACRKRTQQQIEDISGIPILVTRQDVDEAELSLDGSYKPERRDGCPNQTVAAL
ncbi:hypothetical protein ACELLULO517_18130 [Acidisoma cellulosilytica]|uniref:Uncharacterized protein n=1 Tax=Acidisoma cellulosilyticum TaxID=2802395 RepID=A0A963Z529_9PROT|nr:hypothetical protein [Acidisoma cellulosilyticum]MCB8882170.1 hypothetical protein [Acidisoma cellulosilyticum]